MCGAPAEIYRAVYWGEHECVEHLQRYTEQYTRVSMSAWSTWEGGQRYTEQYTGVWAKIYRAVYWCVGKDIQSSILVCGQRYTEGIEFMICEWNSNLQYLHQHHLITGRVGPHKPGMGDCLREILDTGLGTGEGGICGVRGGLLLEWALARGGPLLEVGSC